MSDRITMKRLLREPWVDLIRESRNGNALVPLEQKQIAAPAEVFWRDSALAPWATDLDREVVGGRVAFAASALAYICINYRAQKLCEPPIVVVEETDDGEEWIEGHELNGLLAHPNADETMRQFYYLTSLYRDLTGACLWLKVRDRGKRVGRLAAFSKEDVTVTSANGRMRGRFKVRTQEGVIELPPEDVIYFVNVDPADPVNGAVAPLDAALTMLNLHGSLRVQARNMVKNAVRPTGAFMTKDQLSDEQYKRLSEQMTAQHAGAQNAGKWMLVEGGAEWRQISESLTSLVPGELISWVEATVCPIFQLHPSMLGIKTGVENAPWSNLEQATRLIYDMMCLPRWASDEEVLTDNLLRDFDADENHLIRFDMARIPALQEDVAAKLEAYKSVLHTLTVNEIRGLADFNPLDGPEGDIRYVPVTLVPSDQLGMVDDEPFGDNGEPAPEEEPAEEVVPEEQPA